MSPNSHPPIGKLVDQKGFQNGVRRALVQVVTRHINHARLVIEAVIDAPWRMGGGVEPLLNVEHQDLIELGDGLGGPVVPLHQRLAGPHQRFAAGLGCGGVPGVTYWSMWVRVSAQRVRPLRSWPARHRTAAS